MQKKETKCYTSMDLMKGKWCWNSTWKYEEKMHCTVQEANIRDAQVLEKVNVKRVGPLLDRIR